MSPSHLVRVVLAVCAVATQLQKYLLETLAALPDGTGLSLTPQSPALGKVSTGGNVPCDDNDTDSSGPVSAHLGLQRWERKSFECNNPGCKAVFQTDDSSHVCVRCEMPNCPDCGTCSCESEPASRCRMCSTELSVAERTGVVEHDCW